MLNYAQWRESLLPQDAEVWTELLAGLRPDESGLQSLRFFSFPGQDAEGDQVIGVKHLMTAIQGDEGD